MTDFFGKRCCVIYYGCVFLLKVTFIQTRTCHPLIFLKTPLKFLGEILFFFLVLHLILEFTEFHVFLIKNLDYSTSDAVLLKVSLIPVFIPNICLTLQ